MEQLDWPEAEGYTAAGDPAEGDGAQRLEAEPFDVEQLDWPEAEGYTAAGDPAEGDGAQRLEAEPFDVEQLDWPEAEGYTAAGDKSETEFLRREWQSREELDSVEQLDMFEIGARPAESLDLGEDAQTDQFEEMEAPVDPRPVGSARLGVSMLDELLQFETGASSFLIDRVKGVASFVLGPALRRGAKGPAIAALQRALVALGHNIEVDADFGRNTDRAVRAFQASARIDVNGVVEASTKSAIIAALRRRGQAPGPTASGLCDAIARVAEQEYRRWHPGGIPGLRETDVDATPILQQYYRDGVKVEVSARDVQSAPWQTSHPWSAVFVSWVMRTAGAGGDFGYSRAHQNYIRAARRTRLDGNSSSPFWAYKATEVAPQVGDLVCAARANSGATYDNIGDARSRATHCDIVTEVQPGQLRVIGGNVNHNVDAKTIRTLPTGLLALDGNQSQFFAVLRCRGRASQLEPSPTPIRPTVPAIPSVPTVFTREDVWTLSAIDRWHPTILWYARMVADLQGRDGPSLADPTGWLHIANTHGTSLNPRGWPSGALWNQCEHFHWYFLAWHRVYVHHLEKIARETVVRLGGPSNWALPFWNYSDTTRPDCRRLPPAFREQRMPNGSPNPLFVTQRNPNINLGTQLDPGDVDINAAMRPTQFASLAGVDGFGGGVSARNHSGNSGGPLEFTPHGAVHVAVGGLTPTGLPLGFMSSFETAARDPIFWLHHANIDRLWEEWLQQPQHVNPGDARWLNEPFEFGSGVATTRMRVRDTLSTSQPPLSYLYDVVPTIPSIPPPVTPAPSTDGLVEASNEGNEEAPPELVGASMAPVQLGPAPASVTIRVVGPTGPQREAEAVGKRRIFLKLENVRGTQLSAGAFDVYVNIPSAASPADYPDRIAGRLAMFGVIEASRISDRESGSGIGASFEITDIARRLQTAGDWDANSVRLTFMPAGTAGATGVQGDVSVGRVSVFYG